MMSRKPSTSDNHEMAPLSAAFVKQMREVFGDVIVLIVDENTVKIKTKTYEELRARYGEI